MSLNNNSVLKALLIISLIIGIIAITLHFVEANSNKTAFINSPMVVDGYKETANVRAELQNSTRIWRANVDSLAMEIQERIRSIEAERPSLSNKEYELSLELLNNKRTEFERYRQSVEEKVQRETQKRTEGLLTKINQLTADYASQKGFDLVLGASGDGTIIYAKSALDITDEVIEHINTHE